MKKLLLTLFFLILLFSSCYNVLAQITTVPTPVKVESLRSSSDTEEYYMVRTPLNESNVIYVEGKTKVKTKRFAIRVKKHKSSSYNITVFVAPNENGEFSIKINTKIGNSTTPTVIDNKGYVTQSDETWGSRPGYKAVEQMSKGIYHLTIARATTDEDADVSQGSSWTSGSLASPNGEYAYKEFLLQVTGDNNNPKLIYYPDVVENNNEIQNMYENTDDKVSSYKNSTKLYKDKYMKDISFVFKNPKTGNSNAMNSTRVNYMIKISDNITKGAENDYEKVRKIYEYISSNFYYDRFAFEKKENQFINPYENLYNLRNKKSNDNSVSGKVATVCSGFGAMVVALSRAQGIPARLVKGYHITSPSTIYQDKTDADIIKDTHWWAEVYVDGRWVIVDANAGTISTWKRQSFDEAGTWNYFGLTTYAGFDPSMEIFSNNYIYHTIYKGSNTNAMISYLTEVKQLKTFLNKTNGNTTNGKIINENYTQAKFATYGTKESMTTDGYGKVYHINWTGLGLTGVFNLSNFTSLKSLYLSNNKITGLKIANCTSLETLYAAGNKFITLDASTATKLTVINLNNNKMKSVKFKDGSKTVTVERNLSVGGFKFKYDKNETKRLTITAHAAPAGYKYLGIYNPSGNRISSKTTYSFNPSSGTYTVRYQKI